MRIKLIGCKSMWKEISAIANTSTHDIDISFLTPISETDINAYINKTTGDYDAILLVMGLSMLPEDGLSNLRYKLVLPKAHNSMSILLGNNSRYRQISNNLEGDILWFNETFDELSINNFISGSKNNYDYNCVIQSPILGYYQPSLTPDFEFMADTSLLKALINGEWDNPEILILEKGEVAVASYDFEVIQKA